jgi:hypothetical protein
MNRFLIADRRLLGGIDPRILPAVRFRWELNGFTLVTTCG